MSISRADELRLLVSVAEAPLRVLDDADVDAFRGDGAWTKRQILGHLVDSTATNHQRFVRAQFEDELHFPPYDAPGWVVVERYDLASWSLLIDVWVAYARLLGHILDVMPEPQLATPVWVDWYGEPKPITLSEVIDAYLDHVRHHLAQLIPAPEV
ncbi:MAG: DinB family protein [Actinobacteria bacterium]|nr:DinB family protein [Actinomycetota bacterium]